MECNEAFCRPSAAPQALDNFSDSPPVSALTLAYKKRALPSPLNDDLSHQLKTLTERFFYIEIKVDKLPYEQHEFFI